MKNIQNGLSENELASFFYDLAETAGRIALDALQVRHRLRAQTGSFAGHHCGPRHRTGIAAIDFHSIPRAWHLRRGNRVNSGRSLYLVYRPDRRDQELHLRNAAVRYLDCSRRRKEGGGHRGDDRYAGAGGAMVWHPERHDVQRGTGQSEPRRQSGRCADLHVVAGFLFAGGLGALRRAQPQGHVQAIWRRLLSIRSFSLGALRSCGRNPRSSRSTSWHWCRWSRVPGA